MLKTEPQVEKNINARHGEFAKLFNARQIEKLVTSYYAPDASYLPPNAPQVTGHDAIQDYFERTARDVSDMRIEPGHVVSTGELAVAHGRYRSRVQTSDGVVEDRGKFVEAWRREQDGSWRCFLESHTSDLEPPAPSSS